MNIEVKPSTTSYKLLIEKDVDVPMRDGARLKADVCRPDDGGKFPAILNLGPYQKDKLWVPPQQLEEKATPSMNWETVTPEWWVPKGYAAVRVDGRGSGKSPGQCEPWSLAQPAITSPSASAKAVPVAIAAILSSAVVVELNLKPSVGASSQPLHAGAITFASGPVHMIRATKREPRVTGCGFVSIERSRGAVSGAGSAWTTRPMTRSVMSHFMIYRSHAPPSRRRSITRSSRR